ncbi:hypothetical protein Tco_1486476, partial [Tanacetum coccineum]
MSKRNLATVTCSLFQSDLVDFVEKYGITLCYDPQLLSSEHTALDTPDGYNPLYLSLFSIAQTFPKSILYLVGLASYWEHAPNVPSIFIDMEDGFPKFYEETWSHPTFSVRPTGQPIDIGIPFVDRLKAMDDDNQGESSSVSKNKEKRSITAELEEGATIIKLTAVGSSLKHEPKRRKQKGPKRASTRGSVPPLPTTTPKGVGKHLRMLARHLGSLDGGSE